MNPPAGAKRWNRNRKGQTWKDPQLVPEIREYLQLETSPTSHFVRRGSRNRRQPLRLTGLSPGTHTTENNGSVPMKRKHAASSSGEDNETTAEAPTLVELESDPSEETTEDGMRKRARSDPSDAILDVSDFSTESLSSAQSEDAVPDSTTPNVEPRIDPTPEDATPSIVPTTSASDKRPEPHGQPLVWAEGRQALCESVIYFRSYQSGAYFHEGTVRGFLVDKQCGERDYIDDEIVITRAGGGLRRSAGGEMEAVNDHSCDSTMVKNFKKNQELCIPLVVIVGKGNPNCPTKIPYTYCVLGYFQVTGIWCERVGGKKCVKFRFDKIDLESKSWWSPKGSPNPPGHRDYEAAAPRQNCVLCGSTHPQIYQQGWMCLNGACKGFWKINGTEASVDLVYTEAYLKERTKWPQQIKVPHPLRTSLFSANSTNILSSFARRAWRGYVCPDCGRCNSRSEWSILRCGNHSCSFSQVAEHHQLSPEDVMHPFDTRSEGHAIPEATHADWVTKKWDFLGNYRVHTYNLLSGNTITMMLANDDICKQPDGPDIMFKKLQVEDIGLRRFPLSCHGLTGETLTQHFAVNFGMDYKYVVDVNSRSFREAPAMIVDAVNRLNWAGKAVVKDDTFTNFNELLAIGYFEQQKINYHDDGESTLGPTIATLSLGCPAVMTIRMKASHFNLPKRDQYSATAPVLYGSRAYRERLALNSEYGKIPHEEWNLKVDKLYELWGPKKNSPVLVSMRLRHGDMVVMHGGELQKYFEHSVAPEGSLRFALTCRYVQPELIPEDRRWKGEYTPQMHHGDEISRAAPNSAMATPPLTNGLSSPLTGNYPSDLSIEE